ncbi:MAG TPA: heme-copper oxidase subunit III [Gemmatimonadaceae bacterium]|jgi:heme/copper-type cytochrome/quinol oxidase subunit 3
MVLFCLTEAMLFAYLLASYLYVAVANREWPPPGFELPKLQLPLIMTALLLSSSGAAIWAEKGIERDERGRFRIGLLVAFGLGAAFLVLQMREYAEKLQHMGPREHAYVSLFFTITGFHGVHVAFGLVLMLYLGLRSLLGHFDAHRHLAVKNVFLYWHTVDGVWLAILTAIYLSPQFYR